MGGIDVAVFLLLAVFVIGIGLWASRGEKTHSEHGAQDYFLAGRGLTWWLVGFSLIAANISTEQFVGMSGKAAAWLGMAIASYEWMAAITLVVVAFVFLPKFLKSGIYTIPEFLEYRYNTFARTRNGDRHADHPGRRADRVRYLLRCQGHHRQLPGRHARPARFRRHHAGLLDHRLGRGDVRLRRRV